MFTRCTQLQGQQQQQAATAAAVPTALRGPLSHMHQRGWQQQQQQQQQEEHRHQLSFAHA